jgi:protein-arginine kinase activator protein McsA
MKCSNCAEENARIVMKPEFKELQSIYLCDKCINQITANHKGTIKEIFEKKVGR